MSSQAPLARTRIIEAKDMLSHVFTTLDEVGPLLDAPERDAALQLRTDISAVLRRMNALALFLECAP